MDAKVKNFMSKNPVTIQETMGLEECEELLALKKISGGPVINETYELVGVISKTDFTEKRYEDAHDGMSDTEFVEYQEKLGIGGLDGFQVEMRNARFVGDIMNRNPVTCNPEDSMFSVAKKMKHYHIHRVIVTEQKKVVGVVSSFDIIRLVCKMENYCKGKFSGAEMRKK
ncbi:HPP family protein [Candidatus Riflebacteria bacterium]